MADVKTDLLSLQYSQNFAIEGLQEANVDLELPPASAQTATVFGVVTDGSLPVADATVKLFDSAGLPFMHTLTDAAGAYSITGIPAGTYSLGAVKDGYRLSDAAGVTLSSSATTQMDLTLKADATLALGAIAGVLSAVDLTGKVTPLGGAKISLRDSLGAEVAVTYTAADGEFAFYDIADGVYTLMASAAGCGAGSGTGFTASSTGPERHFLRLQKRPGPSGPGLLLMKSGERDQRSSSRMRFTISMAPWAHSEPLLPALVPARSTACSMVSVVRTPNITGMSLFKAT